MVMNCLPFSEQEIWPQIRWVWAPRTLLPWWVTHPTVQWRKRFTGPNKRGSHKTNNVKLVLELGDGYEQWDSGKSRGILLRVLVSCCTDVDLDQCRLWCVWFWSWQMGLECVLGRPACSEWDRLVYGDWRITQALEAMGYEGTVTHR